MGERSRAPNWGQMPVSSSVLRASSFREGTSAKRKGVRPEGLNEAICASRRVILKVLSALPNSRGLLREFWHKIKWLR